MTANTGRSSLSVLPQSLTMKPVDDCPRTSSRDHHTPAADSPAAGTNTH
jgi:hypothetical protein